MVKSRYTPPQTLRIGLSQLNVTVGDLDNNIQYIQQGIATAQAQHCDIVVFPELAITGYPPEDLLLKPEFLADAQAALKDVVQSVGKITAIIGCIDVAQHRLYNAAAICAQGRIRGMYHKMRLPNYGVFDEARYFHAGVQPLMLDWRGHRIGLNICEDIWDADGPVPVQSRAGAQLLINLSASPYHAGKLRARRALIKRWARNTHAYVAYMNLVGGQDELVFDGGSFVMHPAGRMIAQAPSFQTGLLLADIPMHTRSASRSGTHTIRLPVTTPAVRPAITTHTSPTLHRLDEMYAALVLGTRDYVRKNGFDTVVIGSSGGIDSALTILIAADAVGPDHVVTLTMPSQFSSVETQADAATLAEKLGARFWRVPIDPILETYRQTLSAIMPQRAGDVTDQNLQARIRGNLVMATSNTFGWLVLSTGNKSEIATGYCTLYGDMAGGFAVLKDVPKTLVYELAHHRNAQYDVQPIPACMFTRAPTAELAPNQQDQDILPAYDLLDDILQRHIESEQPVRTIATHVPLDTVREVVRMVDRAEYKRRQGAPGVKITPRAFGKDRRMPITNRYRAGQLRDRQRTAAQGVLCTA